MRFTGKWWITFFLFLSILLGGVYSHNSVISVSIGDGLAIASRHASYADVSNISFGYGTKSTWESGVSLLNFFDSNKVPSSLYYNLPPETKELTSEIYAGSTYYIMRDINGTLLRVFIPISEYAQLKIYLDGDGYKLEVVPISFTKSSNAISVRVNSSPYEDLRQATMDNALAREFNLSHRGSVNFKRVVKGDLLVILYDRKYRLGKGLGQPILKVSMMQTNGKNNYAFGFNGKYYDVNAKEISGFSLAMPVDYSRISSKFSYGRLHPLLKTIRPHYGVDFAAKVGSRVRAASDGIVVFSGRKGGYGKVVEISHGDGVKTLYAHMHRISKSVKVGKKIKQNTPVGEVGTTGLSTGPHLHFAVYINNKPVDPLGRIETKRSRLTGKERQEFLSMAKEYVGMVEKYTSGSLDRVRSFGYSKDVIDCCPDRQGA